MPAYPVKYAVDFTNVDVNISNPTPVAYGVGDNNVIYYHYTGTTVTTGELTLQGRHHREDSWFNVAILNLDGDPHEVDVTKILEVRVRVTATQGTDTGTLFGTLKDNGVRSAPPFEDEVARGAVSNWSSTHKFGRNPGIDTGAPPVDIWAGGGVYTGFPIGTAGETANVVSSSADDTAAGTGAQVIELFGLAPGYTEQTELVTLDGTNPVETTGVWVRLNRWAVVDSGSGFTNAGTITINHSTTTANVFISDTANTGGSLLLATTVPAGKVLLLKAAHVLIEQTQGGGTEASITLRVCRAETGEQRTLRHWVLGELAGLDVGFTIPLAIAEKTDLWVRVDSVSANNSIVSGDLEYTISPAP